MHTKDNYGWLDLFRLLAALLVIAIHTSPLGAFSPEGDFFLTRVLARIAVPFFFMVTGQFVAGKFIAEESLIAAGNKPGQRSTVGCRLAFARTFASVNSPLTDSSGGQKVFSRYLRKISVLYALSMILYLPVGIYAGHYQDMTFMSILKMILFDGTFYHLWYFPACLLGIVLVYLMGRFLKLRSILIVSAVLYLIGLQGDSYFGLVQKLPALEAIYDFFFRICSYTRNGLFFAPLFLALGAWCAKGSRRGTAAHLAIFILSFLLMTVEAFTLRHFSWQRHDSMYLMLVPVMISLYRLLLSLPCPCGKSVREIWKRFRSASLWVYILHPAFIIVVRGAAKALHLMPLLVENSLVHYLAVSALSVCAGFGIAFLTKPIHTLFCNIFHAHANTDTSGRLSLPQPSPRSRAWIELDQAALARNVEVLRSLMPEGCRLMPAVKANAYGHGAVWTARSLNRLGIDAFCVACLSEGIALRRADVKGEILILGYTAPEDFALLARYRLTQTIVDYGYAEKLENAGITLHVHIGIDTGMHRLGIRCEDIEDILEVFEMNNLVIDGMFTHLCACDSPLPENRAFTERQIQAFYEVAEIVEESGFPCPKLHLQSSYGLLNYPGLDADYVRVGIALYGVPSSTVNADFTGNMPLGSPADPDGNTGCFERLSPVLSLKARVASVRTLHAGDCAGYGLAFTAEKAMRIAVLSIGYADGLPRELSCGKGHVLLQGQEAPIIGMICMDQTLVDISAIPSVSAGDIAVLIGTSGDREITATQMAAQCGTITNELLSRLGERLERVECIADP
ncbi:MAG: serine racemase VanT catalytic subunit [Blautia sp.]|nr:serine racemase VanT catalytic subunit [Blautia sp.]